MSKIYMGFDLGSKNTAYTVIQYSAKKKKHKIIVCKKFKYCITSLLTNKSYKRKEVHRPFTSQFKLFHRQARKLIRKYIPDRVALERFQSRLGRTGLTSEVINMMIYGFCFFQFLELRSSIELYTAAIWKNHFHRTTTLDLKEFYKYMRPLEPHHVDSCLISFYTTGDKDCFTFLNEEKNRVKFRKECLKVSDIL